MCIKPLPAPKGQKPVTFWVYIARGLLAATAIGIAVQNFILTIYWFSLVSFMLTILLIHLLIFILSIKGFDFQVE